MNEWMIMEKTWNGRLLLVNAYLAHNKIDTCDENLADLKFRFKNSGLTSDDGGPCEFPQDST